VCDVGTPISLGSFISLNKWKGRIYYYYMYDVAKKEEIATGRVGSFY
jgi:hypothetical protein